MNVKDQKRGMYRKSDGGRRRGNGGKCVEGVRGKERGRNEGIRGGRPRDEEGEGRMWIEGGARD